VVTWDEVTGLGMSQGAARIVVTGRRIESGAGKSRSGVLITESCRVVEWGGVNARGPEKSNGLVVYGTREVGLA